MSFLISLKEGFRNVFKDDDSIHEDKDSSLGNLESQTSLSEDAETESEDTASGDDESPDG